ncbi:hypothetical protein O6H91_08G061100 [Diphasiastrum complanatum]|uniref:Uncharacterized protein n=1 Tax=Diphasiastrum complanatum TaxID=34168 RepID=A0ACC2CY30_DIPCM|nr:hypothetical protein O6H91_08G061100 [Diphasiastrum complanatum]
MKTLLVARSLWLNQRRLSCLPAGKTYSAAVAAASELLHPRFLIDRPFCDKQHNVLLQSAVGLDHRSSFLTSSHPVSPFFSLEQKHVHYDKHRGSHSAASRSLLGLSSGSSKLYGISIPAESLKCRGYASRAAGNSNSIDNASQGSSVTIGQNPVTADIPKPDPGASDLGHWSELVSNGLNSALELVKQTGMRALDAMQGIMDPSSAGAIDTLVSASIAVTAYASAWLILPRLLRALHRYVEQGPTARLLGRTAQEQMPYETSVWSALEEPARLFVTLVAFSQLGAMVAPSTVAIHYLEQIWRGGVVVGLVWFLHRWKSSAFARVLTGRKMIQEERERYLALDKISSVGLIIIGAMALAEASGVAVQSVMTVGGIGGVATAFAARDVLGNALSGLALQFTKPFSVGESISAGAVEGQVIEIGLHSTRLLNADKFPVTVPNSFFSSQVIVNKSRAKWRGLNAKFPVHLSSIEKLREIPIEILEKLKADPNVFLEQEPPRCYVSTIGPTHLEIVVSCNIKPMGKDGFFLAQQELLISIAEILTKKGAALGSLES